MVSASCGREEHTKSGGSPSVGGIGITTIHPSNEKCLRKKKKNDKKKLIQIFFQQKKKISIPATVFHPAEGGNVSKFFVSSRHLVKCPNSAVNMAPDFFFS